jgi:hypothetical protein
MCAHNNSCTLHIHTCVHKCFHHLLLLHTTIIKMSLSCLGKLHWFPCPRLLMHGSLNFLHYSIDWSFFHLSPLSFVPLHCFLIPCTPSSFLLQSPFQLSSSLKIKLSGHNELVTTYEEPWLCPLVQVSSSPLSFYLVVLITIKCRNFKESQLL